VFIFFLFESSSIYCPVSCCFIINLLIFIFLQAGEQSSLNDVSHVVDPDGCGGLCLYSFFTN